MNKDTNNIANEKVRALIDLLKEKKATLVLAESCTGGLVSSLLTEVPGASEVFWGSLICYTQAAKASMLDIDNSLMTKFGLVSIETVKAMVIGALKKSGATFAVSCSGIAGPEGDGSGMPVGTVWIACACNNGEISAKEYLFEGSRNEIRLQTAIAALEDVTQHIKKIES